MKYLYFACALTTAAALQITGEPSIAINIGTGSAAGAAVDDEYVLMGALEDDHAANAFEVYLAAIDNFNAVNDNYEAVKADCQA